MKSASDIVLKLLVTLLIAATAEAGSIGKVDDLISQARKYDSKYTLGPQTSQQKALELYQSALISGLSKEQRLETLFRMAQLNGCAYKVSKGEKPDYQKAISLYEQIVNEYPPDEPKVQMAINMISSHYTNLGQFEKSLEWSKKVFEHDISEMTGQLKALEQEIQNFVYETCTPEELREHRKRAKQAASLRKVLDVKERNQRVAVDIVAYSATRIDPLRAHGELRALIRKHPDTVIENRAAERLAENMEKMSQLWAPQNLPIESSETTIQAYSPAPTANLGQKQIGIETKSSNIKPEPKKEICSVEPGATEKLQNHDHTTEVRAPPFSYIRACIIGAIGLIVLGLGVIIKKKKHLFKEFEK